MIDYDMCVFSLDVDGTNAVRAKIYIIHGAMRWKLMRTIEIHRGTWSAIQADQFSLGHVRRAVKALTSRRADCSLPHLVYTWWMLDYCSLRSQRLDYGLNQWDRCRRCGHSSWWGLDDAGRVTCISCVFGDSP